MMETTPPPDKNGGELIKNNERIPLEVHITMIYNKKNFISSNLALAKGHILFYF